jgi:GT2 family glycosyltransferase
MKNCDIIIPVFNAFECLQNCFESVLNYTDLFNNRLIIIDDKSTDKRVIPYIESFLLNKERNITFIKNEKNLGFIKAINIGMKYSDNDVLLLNSDTEVTKNWLEKIQSCAYTKEKVATVTPLLNDAGIVSVPIFANANKIPDGYNLDEYQALIDSISYKEYPEIPFGVGLCLYIKREALDAVGFFDEESYGIAYGEEEDFCYRCLGHGYRHILCDDVIIFHKSSQSLSGYWQQIFEDRKETLTEKYPLYKSNAVKWFYQRPLNYINKNINYNICINNGRSNILIIIHYWNTQFGNDKLIGGTTLHVFDIIKKLRKKYNFHILTPINGMYRIYSYWENGEESIDIISFFSQFFTIGFFDPNYSMMLKKIIDIFKIDIIHIHHMIFHYFDLVDIIKNKKSKLFISLHDYFSICPRINKLTEDNVYCGYPETAECNICISSFNCEYYRLKGNNNISAWKSVWNLLLSSADKIIVPSEATKKEISEIYKNLQINIIEHGVDFVNNKKELDISTDKEFHIAFIGIITYIKGKKIIEELIKYSYQFNDGIYFHLFGYIDSFICENNYSHFIYHGEYNRNELNNLIRINNIKLVCLFSICPETYSYILTESVSMGTPVLAIDLGAIGQRVRENNLGWLIKNGTDISEIYKKIKNIFADKNGYKDVIKSILNYKIKNLDDMCDEYDKIYSSYKVDKNENRHTEKLKEFIKENYLPSITISQVRNEFETMQNNLITERDSLLNSRSWRFTRPLREFAAFVRQHRVLRLFAKGLLSIKKSGIRITIKKIINKIKYFVVKTYKKTNYIRWIKKTEPSVSDLKLQRKHFFSYRPKISIVIPIYNTSPYYFKQLLYSVKAQTYDNWELCLADGSPAKNKKINELCANDKRIKYNFLGENKGISVNTNEAIKLATGDYIAFMDHDDTLAPFALYENVKYINEQPDIEFIYSDEDHLVCNKRCIPYIKPDFAPDTLRSWNYICHFVVMKRSLIESLGGLNSKYDGAQDYDYVLRASEATTKIYHIRKILYHWRKHRGSISESSIAPFLAGLSPVQNHINRLELKGKVKLDEKYPGYFHVIYDVTGNPFISIIIPNKDHIKTLKTCVDSIFKRSTYSNYEIVIVENNSENEETFIYYSELKKHPKVRVLYYPEKGFNYSKIINFGVKNCFSDFIVQLNNDTEVITHNWLELMLGFAQRPDVGAVGAKLLYPNGKIQHAGIYIHNNIINHIHYSDSIKNYIAVTGACVMSRRELYEQIGYMDENFAVAYGDIDLCFALRDKGFLVVYNHNVELYHYESKSRGYEDTPEKTARFNREIEYLLKKWQDLFNAGEPYVRSIAE